MSPITQQVSQFERSIAELEHRAERSYDMRLIALITDAHTVRDILAHLGQPTVPPRIVPARGPPLWTYEFDPRLTW